MIDYLFEALGKMNNAIQPALYQQDFSLSLFAIVMAAGLIAGLTPFGVTTAVFAAGKINGREDSARSESVRGATLFSFGATSILLLAGLAAALAGSVLVDYRIARYLPVVTLIMGLQLLGMTKWRLFPKMALPRGARLSNPFVLGMPFGVITAPCTAPIIVTMLSVVAANGGLVFGALVLLTFSAGRSVPLIAACTYGDGLIRRLNGGWSIGSKVFGVAIIAASVYFLTLGRSYLGA